MEEEHRRLAALMFTDIVGYSTLTQQNEPLALELLEEQRRLLRLLLLKHGGTEIKTIGDGFLVEFASALEAARCAIEIQKTLTERNAAAPTERRIQLRIGLHVGDVVHREHDVLGDGVNIAARIEPLAPSGGICLSQQVFDHIQHKIDEPILKLGKGELKNIKVADIYRIVLPWEKERLPFVEQVSFSLRRKRTRTVVGVVVLVLALAVGSYLARERLWQAEETPTERIALAVLPFQVLTAPEEIGYLGIGIADTVITRLANIGQMRVRPTSAILRYEKQAVDLQEVGRALKTEHVLSGTVQRAGERFRVSVQLVRVSDGVPLWGERYDLAQADLLGLQDAIAAQVATALKIQMTAVEQARVYRRYTENVAAYELYLRGRSHQMRSTREGTRAAVEAFEDALRLDPNYALAHTGLATASANMWLRFAPEAEIKSWKESAEREARRALELDANLAEAHEALAAVYRYTEFDWERAIEESRRALELNPNLDLPHFYRAAAFDHLGLLELVDGEVRAALEINPENRVEPLRARGFTAFLSGRFAEAARFQEEAQRLTGKADPTAVWFLAQSYYYQGEPARAEPMLAQVRRGGQPDTRAQATLASFLAARGERAQAEELLHAITTGTYMDHHVAYSLGVAYAQLGQRDKALRWLRNAVDTGFPCYPWYARDPLLQPLRGDPEFQRFMEDLRKSWEAAKARYAP
jgi:class 3 adenylate cyclase/TolB-like protein/Flp pilus assembly protein TadD